ncbi:helix-turn-helix transcriptional regulator [Pseudoclavibacter chungangensis]|uniref:Helix-turn-helix transcriptional regulator n=1 Tax=Pseudoclavibacter chungangensis TaxID=587635 RepID=A0A7J5C331_9MICO|nr:helix-turn-helix transcriptional regulator [Pseudoclavibacter chungangensis]KAB1662237.1 helix-turn-helix transcriptional regulator [Pseudoclavibacter chungangensis]NYJ65440.1 transcriptional regulator with XRE-family HTH domain [Pseudoclavibacter chungangensis]
MSDDPWGTHPVPRRLLFREALGREAHDERVRRGERLVDVAHAAALSPQYLSEIERGRKDPSSEVLRELAQALGLDPLDLVERAARRMADARAADRQRVTLTARRARPGRGVRVRAGFGAPATLVTEEAWPIGPGATVGARSAVPLAPLDLRSATGSVPVDETGTGTDPVIRANAPVGALVALAA